MGKLYKDGNTSFEADIDTSLIGSLATRFGFDADLLENELAKVQLSLQIEAYINENHPTAKDRIRSLRYIDKTAQQLVRKIEELPLSTAHELKQELIKYQGIALSACPDEYFDYLISMKHPDKKGEPYLDDSIYEFLFMVLGSLAQAARSIEKQTRQKKAHTSKSLRDSTIKSIAAIWVKLSGASPTYTTNWMTGERGGNFVTFLVSSAEAIGFDSKPLPERFRRLKEKGDIPT